MPALRPADSVRTSSAPPQRLWCDRRRPSLRAPDAHGWQAGVKVTLRLRLLRPVTFGGYAALPTFSSAG